MSRSFLPCVKEIPYCDPVSLFERWHQKKWAILLHSALTHEDYGRYSYLAIEPYQVLWAKNACLSLDDMPVGSDHNPFQLLQELLAKTVQALIPDLPPFQGGVAGAWSYDLYQYLEPIPAHALDDTAFPDMALGFYDVVISFDHRQEKSWVVSTGLPERSFDARLAKATKRLNEVLDWCLLIEPPGKAAATNKKYGISSNFDETGYTNAVQRVIDYIVAGDIFEANISQRFMTRLPSAMAPFDLYKGLQRINPAPFSAFMNLGDFQVVSASPERFLRLEQGKVETRPIKGTRSRSADSARDWQLAEELKSSEKDRAENVMIVDLLRNDLSKVCTDHSVQVSQLCGLESYASVHHLVSVINGELKAGYDAVDLLLATFPGGSITGAPKIRAMEIIAEIEPTSRGMYCGCLGFIGFNGSMDTSIAIRTYTIKGDIVTFQAGGAVVLDSIPDSEYQETLVKSSSLLEALGSLS